MYERSNPPRRVLDFGFSGRGGVWLYASTDPVADVNAAGYVDNARDLGMHRGDLVLVRQTSNARLHLCAVDEISDAGAATLVLNQTLYLGALAPEELPS